MDDLTWDTDSSVIPDTVVVAFTYKEGNRSRGAVFANPDLFAVDESGMVFIVGFSRWRETGLFPHPNSSDIRKISQARNPDWYRE